jgi:hypothetical protein
VLGKLAALEQIGDARVCFRVAVRPPRGALQAEPLAAREFLHGRRRARERAPRAPASDAAPWRVLGLLPGAGVDEIKRAYRRLARTVHPDAHPQASDEERRTLSERFAALTDAYRKLVA